MIIQDKEIDCILKPADGRKGNLYISNLPAAEDVKKLKSLNIKFVLTVANLNTDNLRSLYQAAGIQHYAIDVPDKRDVDIQKYFEETYTLIDQHLKEASVLVHCFVGVSRSATIVLAYLMRLKRITYEKALQLVKTKRPDVMPNVGFIQRLLEFEETIVKSSKRRVK